MKKFIFLTLISAIAFQSSFGQRSAYYDAIYLRDVIKKDQGKFHLKDIGLPLQEYYFGRNLPGKSIDSLIKLNPFLNTYYESGVQGSLSNLQLPDFISQLFPGSAVTKIADGLAKFTVERVKTELSISFFNQFKDDLDANHDLQVLFPNTYNVLITIDKEIYNYTSYLEMIREAFIYDFKVLLPNLKKVIQDPDARYFKQNQKLKSIILIGLSIAVDFQNNVLPGDMIKNLAYDPNSNLIKIDTGLNASVQVLNLLIQSLRSNEVNQYIVSFDSVYSNVVQNEVCFRTFLGLVYQKSKNQNIYFKNKKSFCSVLDSVFNKPRTGTDPLQTYINIIKELENRFSVVENSLNALKEKNKNPEAGNKAAYGDYYFFYDATLNLVEYASDIPALLRIPVHNYKKDDYFFAARNLGNIYLEINEKKYASAILKVVVVYDSLLLKQNENKSKYILKYGNFAAAIARAETSEDVKNAIEAVALPVGSSRFKRETAFSVSLNNYTGISGGLEYFPKLTEKQTAPVLGVSAPIGLSFNWGDIKSKKAGNEKRGGKSLSLFISIIDIGALATYRFQDDSSAVASNIQLKNIIAPGIYGYYGLGKCPISIGAGIQVGPQLRDVSAEMINIDNNFYIKIGINITVDIPIFNLYTRQKNKSGKT